MRNKRLIVNIKDLDKIIPLIEKFGVKKLIKIIKKNKKVVDING